MEDIRMDFEKVISHVTVFEPFTSIKYTHIMVLLQGECWTNLKEVIRMYSLSGEKVWLKGYALLDKVVECRDPRLVELLAKLFSSLQLHIETNNTFPLLKFIFYYSIRCAEQVLICRLLSVGVCVNDNLNGHTPLSTAICWGARIEIVRFIIDQGACVNGKNKSGLTTPLACVIACHPFNLEVAELLLSHGADLNELHPSSNESLVHLACNMEEQKGLKWLLNHKVDPNVQDECGNTGLHVAVSKGNKRCVLSLLQHGALPNVLNTSKRTPLFIAVETNNFKIAEILLQHGAENRGDSLSQAFRNNVINYKGPNNCFAQRKTIKILAKYCIVIHAHIHDQAFVHAAARNGHYKTVKKCLEAGISPNSVFDNTPLIYDAIKSKDKDLVEVLIDYGAKTIYEECIGVSALTISVSSNLIEITKLLLAKSRNELSEACVFYAAENLNLDMLNVLIQFGAKLNRRDEFTNHSPLHFAILSHNHISRLTKDIDLEKAKVVKLLLDHGVTIHPWRDLKPYEHPIHIAISLNYVQVAKVLLEAGASLNHFVQVGCKLLPSTILHFAVEYKSNEMVKVLLEKGASVDALQFDGRTPLEVAVGSHSWNTITVLLENGANVRNTSTCNKNLVFHAVEERCPSEIIAELLKFGADADSRGYGRKTALHNACLLGDGDVVAVLLDHGADVNAVDLFQGHTPFMDTKKTSLAMRIVAQGNWFGYEQGESIAGPSTPIYHLQRHAFKMNLIGLPLHPSFKPVLELEYSEDFVSSCKEEIQVMKYSKINASNLCLYDIIKQIPDPGYVTNKSVLMNLDDNDIWRNLFLYRGILKDCIKKAKLRNKLIDSGQKGLYYVLNCSWLHYLPNEVIRKILCYLNNEELQILQ